MGYFDKYKSFLYDNRNEKDQKEIGLNILKYIMSISEIDNYFDSNLTPNEFIGLFEETDINWVVDLLKKALDNNFDYNYKKDLNMSNKMFSALENILAYISSDYIIGEINDKNNNKDTELLSYIPENFKNITYYYANLSDDLNVCIDFLGSIQISVKRADIKSEINIDNFDKLCELYNFLNTFESIPAEEIRKKKISSITEGLRSTFVKTMMDTLRLLYSTGFSGFPEEGIMISNKDNSPILHIDYRTNKVVYKKMDTGLINDYSINKAILETVPMLKNVYISDENEKEPVPNVNYFIEHLTNPSVCYELHLQLQSANIRYSKGKTSISKWIKETKGMSVEEWVDKYNNCKMILQKWSDVEKWYIWTLETIFIDALMQYEKNGNKLEGTLEELNIYSQISAALVASLKNIIVVAERDNKKFSSIDLRVSASTPLDFTEIENSVNKTLNIGGTNIIKCVEKSKNDKNVVFFTVIFDEKEATKGNLFAGDVIDKFIESGNKPSWGHALIGKKEDGSLFFWDKFMDAKSAGPESRCYTIYAASRSGKGTMTSTLVASALADKRQVFYTDGKPENGPVMGMVAWEKGKEAYVFDGKPMGMDPFSGYMEKYTNGLRKEGEIGKYLYELPKCLFESEGFTHEIHLKFLGLMRYLKSLNLCAEILHGRAEGGENGLPKDNWQIWIFDEMTSMSSNEKDIRVLFAKYCAKKGVPFLSKTVSKSKEAAEKVLTGLDYKTLKPDILNPNSPSYDAGIAYIGMWSNWCNQLLGKISEANVISLGKADANLIFIFQQPDWLRGHGSITTIGKIVNSLQSTKIVGRGGIVAESGEYGDDTLKRKHWKQQIDIEGAGNWAMSSGRDIRNCEVTLFKPFNIWTVPLKNGKMSTDSLSEEEANHYFKGYINKLLGAFGDDPSEIIESAYLYADNAVKQLNLLKGENRNDLKDYLYDCINLTMDKNVSLKDSYNSIIGVKEEEEQGEMVVSEESSLEDTEGKPHENEVVEITGENGTEVINVDVRDDTDTLLDRELEMLEKQKTVLLNKYKAKYNEVIDFIKRDKDKLFSIPNEERNQIKFNSLKNEILRKFESSYVIKKENFIEDIRKEVRNAELLTLVTEYYESLFSKDFNNLKEEISNKELEIQSVDTNSDVEDIFESASDSISKEFSDSEVGSSSLRTAPITQEPKQNVNNFVNKSVISSIIETGDTRFNVENVDGIGNVKASTQLTSQIIKDIIKQFGGVNNIDEITITANESLVINGYTYMPQFNNVFYNSLGAAVLQDLGDGKIGRIVNLGAVVNAIKSNIYSLSIESPKIANSNLFKSELGVTRKGYGFLFNTCGNLQTINLPNEELTRNNPNSNERIGIGAKLANLFGFGKTDAKSGKQKENYIPDPTPTSKDNQLVDKMFESRPVRILTGALGWTLGCKAVVLAATLFGPWGLLFGGLAMAGTYTELKNNKGQQNNYGTTQKDNGGYQQGKKNNSYNQQRGKRGRNNQQRR